MNSNTRGFSIVELSLAALFGVILIGAAATTLIQDARGADMLIQEDVPTLSAQKAMETIAEEIGMSSFLAEDKNGDGLMESVEDLNVNGVLDSDWSLADASSATSLTFNRRIDLMFDEGSKRPSTAFSSAITYRLSSGRIIRETKVTATGRMLRTTLAHNVASMRFTRNGTQVQIDLTIRLRDGQTRTLARTVLVRD